jgi:hypothetical protein
MRIFEIRILILQAKGAIEKCSKIVNCYGTYLPIRKMLACVVDRHLLNPNPDPTFHFDADSDPDPGP